jgi:hypothetical protein
MPFIHSAREIAELLDDRLCDPIFFFEFQAGLTIQLYPFF